MEKPDDKSPDLIEQLVAADWPRLRKKGRSNFIWTKRLLPIAVPSSILTTLGFFYALDFSATDVLTLRGMGMTYVVFVFMGYSVYRHSAKEWTKREQEFVKRTSPAKPSDEIDI